ncbi:hypothetical protein ACS0TY_000087 [Phlomoides rotata]
MNLSVCLSVISKERVIFFRKHFVIEVRELRYVTKVFKKNCEAGSQLENIVFEITDSQGKIDESIHDEDKHGKPHTLTIKSDSFEIDDTVGYSFRYGRCTVRSILLRRKEGTFSCTFSLSRVKNGYKDHRLGENDHVLGHSASFSQETRRALSPQSYKKQEDNHRSTWNDEDTRNVIFSSHGPCENELILRHSPSLKVSRETRGAFSPRCLNKQVHVENAREENHRSTWNDEHMRNVIFSSHRPGGNNQILRLSPSLNVSRETHRAFSPKYK